MPLPASALSDLAAANLLRTVKDHPGLTRRKTRLKAELPRRSFDAAVRRLEAAGLITVWHHGPNDHLYPANPATEQQRRQALALQDERAILHRFLLNSGPLPLNQVLQHFQQELRWPLATTRWRLSSLKGLGLLARVQRVADDRRRSLLQALQPDPDLRELFPATLDVEPAIPAAGTLAVGEGLTLRFEQ